MIVSPMAGFSSRFFKEGYDKPKYMLDLHGRPVFDYALSSFSNFFETERFVFVVRNEHSSEIFLRERLSILGIKDPFIFVVESPTRGQAHTVSIALERADALPQAPVTIFNIDSFRPGFMMTKQELDADGFIEVFEGLGDNWSFVKSSNNFYTHEGVVTKVSEKSRISNLCCTGLYHFRSRLIFDSSYSRELVHPSQLLKEEYIAPIYNQIIKSGGCVRYRIIPKEKVVVCGGPEEYKLLCANKDLVDKLNVDPINM